MGRARRLAAWLALAGAGACARESAGLLTPSAYDPGAREALRLASGPSCLARLERLGIEHRRLRRLRGVATPVVVTGRIGGIRYAKLGRSSLTCDCRLVLALHRASEVLRGFGVSEVQHSGAYAYRRTRSGRLSLHARGLALDAHRFLVAGEVVSVVRSFRRGLGSGCDAGAPPLNRMACDLRQLGLFRELITPDHDADHRDHFHLGIAPPAGGSRPVAATPGRSR